MGCMDVSPKVVKESRAFYQKVSTGEGRCSLSWLNGMFRLANTFTFGEVATQHADIERR
jgi:hypothetical protein